MSSSIEYKWLHVHSGDPSSFIRYWTDGRVFHVTKLANWHRILESGQIMANIEGSFDTTFGSSQNSFFRNRNCVSLFDYRRIHEDEPRMFANRCSPTRALNCDTPLTILRLKHSAHKDLNIWSEKEFGPPVEMVVPYVEAGYHGAVPLDLLDTVLFLSYNEPMENRRMRALHNEVVQRLARGKSS